LRTRQERHAQGTLERAQEHAIPTCAITPRQSTVIVQAHTDEQDSLQATRNKGQATQSNAGHSKATLTSSLALLRLSA